MRKNLLLNKIKVLSVGAILLLFIVAYQFVPFLYLGMIAKIDLNGIIEKHLIVFIGLVIGASIIIWIFIHMIQNFYKENINQLEASNAKLNEEIKERQKLQSEILKSQTRLEQALEVSQAVSWDMDLVTRTLTHSAPRINSSDYGDANLSQSFEHLSSFMHPDDLSKYISAMESFIQGEVPIFETEFRLQNNTADWIWVMSRGKAVEWDDKGKPIRLIGTNFDITERKLAEEKIIESEQRFRRTFDQSPIGAAIVSIDLYFLRANEVFCKIIDYSEEELTQLKFSDITFPEDLDTNGKQLQRLIDGELDQFNSVKRYIRKDGSIVWVDVSVRPLKDIADKTICFLPMFQDITEFKLQEERLQEERNLLRTIVDNLPIGLYIKDFEARKVLSNPMDVRYIGKTEQEVLGKSDLDFFTSEIASQTLSDDLEVLNSGLPIFNKEEHLVNALGESIWLLTTKIPQKNQAGKVVGIIGMGLDITERKHFEDELIKAKERAEESDNLKSAFLANMSHEIRTPMNAILGFSELLTRPGLTEDKKIRFTKLINERAMDLLRIIEDILDISKIEIGQMKLIESETSVYKLLNELYDYYLLKKDNLKPDSKINFIFTPDSKIKNRIISIDEHRLKQILTNFLDNSFKFTFEGTIDLGCKISDNHELLFYVSDTGIGIPLEKQQIIFDRFRQAEEIHTTRQFGGTGLGLSIAKGLSDLMGGKIWVESIEDNGSCFYFSIPLPEVVLDSTEELDNSHPNGTTILIEEDNETNIALIKDALTTIQVDLIHVTSGTEALKIFMNNPKIDLVLLDIRFPDNNGLHILKEMKQLRPEVPVIAQTVHATSSELTKCLHFGFNTIISKPIQADQLLELVGQYIQKPVNN